jgi:hypothetical protein
VRANLSAGQFGSAYEAALGKDARLRDRLLRALSVGTLGLYASRTDSSVWALDRAWAMSEDRWSKHIAAGFASAVVNDYVLPYTPGRTERLFIPFYGALSWLSRGDRDDAAVEARRLAQLLGEASADSGYSVDGEVRGLLHYVAGAVFEAAGDRGAAEVAYRNAARLVTVPLTRDSSAADSLSGDVVVVLERGFVGHPVPRDETIWVSRGELSSLRAGDDDRAMPVARRVGMREGMRGIGPGYYAPRGLDMGISINWAEFREPRDGASSVSVSALGAAQSMSGGSNVTRAVRADFERGQPARFARALLRAATRATLYKAAGDQLARAGGDQGRTDKTVDRKRGRAPGDVSATTDRPNTRDGKDDNKDDAAVVGRVLAGIGLFALAATSQVNDRPDMRSWNLLPNDLRVVRLRLPSGEQEVRAVVDGEPVIVGRARVRAGQVTVLSYRTF